ncbi:MAG TPA: carboxypeptidase-like regulatory domain-containing protein [Planctomycetota bacterium]|nr:carboxypeptidase-like regulatory domain-containing protein [Planctomycetota bacterium]
MRRAAVLLAGIALSSCGKGSAPSGFAPITGTLQLTLTGDADAAGPFWVILRRDGAEDFRVEQVSAGKRTTLSWREEVNQPRDWRLKFGPSKHPTYMLIVSRGAESKPAVRVNELDLWRDPARSLAIAWFAVPLDGEKELALSLSKAAPLDVAVSDPEGAPVEGERVVGIATPRYFFFDGFDPEKVDALQLSWSWDFWSFDHAPKVKIAPERIVTAKTDAKGACRLDAFTGWVGISERDERFVMPRSVLSMPDVRTARFAVVRSPASVRLSVEGLPGKDHTITERGIIVEGDWPVPDGAKPARWSDKLSFLQGKTAEFFTPCRDVRIRPMSKVHRAGAGGLVEKLLPGETRKHPVVLEEIPHKTIEGEVQFEASEQLTREHCTIELYEDGGSTRLVRAMGNLGGPGVPRSGRVAFAFHVEKEGPYTIAVRTGGYTCPVVRGVKAPKEELIIPVVQDRKNIGCELSVKAADGSPVSGFVVGGWPHRDLVNDFISGSRPSGKPGANTFVIHAESGGAILRDVVLEEGKTARLEATLGPGARVRGRVLDAVGKPVAGQWVHLSWPGYFRMASAFRWLSDLTGEDGRFEIARVPPGPWRLFARGSGVPAGAAFNVPAAGEVHEAGDLILPPP